MLYYYLNIVDNNVLERTAVIASLLRFPALILPSISSVL